MSNLVMKLQKDAKQEDVIQVKTQDWYGSLVCYDELSEALTVIFKGVLIKNPEYCESWVKNSKSLSNLEQIIEEGFKVKIVENNGALTLIILKGQCSISFTATKEQGIANVLIQAEEWAESMMVELNKNNNI